MSQLRISELDFDDIKTNLKSFLQSQSEFSDFDFEGSGLNVLLDILAYNTHYNAFYGNMLLTESFLDSAVKRTSAISIAKHLGYTPQSVKGAKANIDVKVINPTGLPPRLTLDAYTVFTSTVNGSNYNFLTTEAYTAGREGNEYNFTNVSIKEGSLQEFSYVVTDTTPKAKYEIPSADVDTSTLLVSVQKSATDLTKEVYTLTEDLTSLTRDSKVYFLDLNPFEKYQIYFGDGILGKSLEAGNIVTIKYLVSSGVGANISNKITQTFQSSVSIGGSNNITVITNSNSSEGKAKENITSIKHYAPKFGAARNRCVTAADFEALIHTNYSGAQSITVWGGEDNNPPIYGKVFVSLNPFEGFIISNETKENIKSNILKSKQGLTIQVEFVDPEFIYVGLKITEDYDYTITTKSSKQLYNETVANIKAYFANDLQKFNSEYKHSTLIKNILGVDSSIVSVLASVTLQKRIIPVLNSMNIFKSSNTIKFRNSIRPGTFESSNFYVMLNGIQTLVKINDLPNSNPADPLGSGSLRLVNVSNGVVINSNIGSIDYAFGVIEINGITPVALPFGSADIRFTCEIQEKSYNLQSERNEIFMLDDSVESQIIGTTEGLTVAVNSVAG